MLAARVATAAVLLAACIGAMFTLPGTWWSVLLGAALLAAAHEWGALAGYGRAGRWVFCGALALSALAVGAATGTSRTAHGAEIEAALYAAACAFWILVAPAWLARGWRLRPPLAAAATGWIVLVPAWLALARLQSDPLQLLYLLGIVWLADTAAYASGRAWGRHKLAPGISPGKTWEGVAGAAAAVAVYYVLLSALAPARPWTEGWGGALLFVAVAAAGVLGDLFESWAKRQAGVKDSGALLPGHGGILDRIDALLAAMPLAALVTRFPL